MSLESVEEVETAPSGSFEEVTSNPEFESGAPPPRRRSLSKLRRRLSRTFRLSFSGSLSDFAHTFTIDERGENADTEGTTKSLVTEDILPNKFNGKPNFAFIFSVVGIYNENTHSNLIFFSRTSHINLMHNLS